MKYVHGNDTYPNLLHLTVIIMSHTNLLYVIIMSRTIEHRFTLKLVHDIIITYNRMHHTDKYTQHKLTHFASLAKWLSVHL